MRRFRSCLGLTACLALCGASAVAQSEVRVRSVETTPAGTAPVEVRRTVIAPQDGGVKAKSGAKATAKPGADAKAKATPKTESKMIILRDGKVTTSKDGVVQVESAGGEGGGAMQLVIDSVVEGVDDCCDGLKEGLAELQVELGDLDIQLDDMTIELSSLGESTKAMVVDLVGECEIETEACATDSCAAEEKKNDCCCCCCKKNNCCKDDGKKAKATAKSTTKPKPSGKPGVWVTTAPRRDGPEWKTDEIPKILNRRLPAVAPKFAAGRERLEGAREKVMQRLAEARKAILSNAREEALKALDQLKKTIESLDADGEVRATQLRSASIPMPGLPPLPPMPPMPHMPHMPPMPSVPHGAHAPHAPHLSHSPHTSHTSPEPVEGLKATKATKVPKASKAPSAPKTLKVMRFHGDSGSAHGGATVPAEGDESVRVEELRFVELAGNMPEALSNDDRMRDELEQLRRELQELREEIRAFRRAPNNRPVEEQAPVRVRRIERL